MFILRGIVNSCFGMSLLPYAIGEYLSVPCGKVGQIPGISKSPMTCAVNLIYLRLANGLPSSWYQVHFYVASSWESNITSAPDHATHIVKTISPEEQLAWLEGQLQKHPEQLIHFEHACLFSTLGDTNKRNQEI